MEIMEAYGNYISWAVFGLIAGMLAKMLLPGKDPGGLIVTASLGIGGAFVGNYIYAYCTGDMYDIARQFSLSGLFLAVMGGMCMLFCYRVLFGQFGRAR